MYIVTIMILMIVSGQSAIDKSKDGIRNCKVNGIYDNKCLDKITETKKVKIVKNRVIIKEYTSK